MKSILRMHLRAGGAEVPPSCAVGPPGDASSSSSVRSALLQQLQRAQLLWKHFSLINAFFYTQTFS